MPRVPARPLTIASAARSGLTFPLPLSVSTRGVRSEGGVRNDRIDRSGVVTLRVNGWPHHIGIGRTHVILLVDDLHARVVDAITGELLRELSIDPARDRRQANPNRRPPEPVN